MSQNTGKKIFFEIERKELIFLANERPWLDRQFRTNGPIKRPDELKDLLRDPSVGDKSDVLDRVLGSMVGLALGDTLGAFVEFRPHDYMLANPVTKLESGGTWGLKKGQVFND